jgi:hypothetical protein
MRPRDWKFPCVPWPVSRWPMFRLRSGRCLLNSDQRGMMTLCRLSRCCLSASPARSAVCSCLCDVCERNGSQPAAPVPKPANDIARIKRVALCQVGYGDCCRGGHNSRSNLGGDAPSELSMYALGSEDMSSANLCGEQLGARFRGRLRSLYPEFVDSHAAHAPSRGGAKPSSQDTGFLKTRLIKSLTRSGLRNTVETTRTSSCIVHARGDGRRPLAGTIDVHRLRDATSL